MRGERNVSETIRREGLRGNLSPPASSFSLLIKFSFLENFIHLIKLFPHVEIEVDAIEGGAPFVLGIGHEATIGLHIRQGALIHALNLLFILALIDVLGDVDTGQSGIVIGIAGIGIEGQEALAKAQTVGIALQIEQNSALGKEEQFVE